MEDTTFESRRALRRAVEQVRGTLPDLTWEAVEPDFTAPYGQADLDDILRSLAPKEPLHEDCRQHREKKSPQTAIESRVANSILAADAMLSRVQQVRLELFGQIEPLFKAVQEAELWLAGRAEAEVHWASQAVADDPKLRAALLCQVRWKGREGQSCSGYVVRGRGLGLLFERAEILSSCANITTGQALLCILVGGTPIVEPVKIGLIPGAIGRRIQLTIEPWATAEQVLAAHRAAIATLGGEPVVRLREHGVADLARAFLNQRRDMDPWERLKEWNQRFPHHGVSSPDNLDRMARPSRRRRAAKCPPADK